MKELRPAATENRQTIAREPTSNGKEKTDQQWQENRPTVAENQPAVTREPTSSVENRPAAARTDHSSSRDANPKADFITLFSEHKTTPRNMGGN
ncbi:hypothetical protein AVEN_113705-1 [Araneus ventricosus]|uniref:Uncharacterized protein n=1 Tax=Araneus ventricosus TaxID=182803 RepID=A0A4Y2TRR7_ARAVE|nr:hypothetical protein AVEN_113705-1 [Araneus ventricosus]